MAGQEPTFELEAEGIHRYVFIPTTTSEPRCSVVRGVTALELKPHTAYLRATGIMAAESHPTVSGVDQSL